MSAPTYIYFVQAGKGPIKIGISLNPIRRLVKMGADNHERLTLLAVMLGDMAAEQGLHKAFSAANVRGEWFNPTPEILEYIRTHARSPADHGFNGLTRSQSEVLVAVDDNSWREWRSPKGRDLFVTVVRQLGSRGLIEHNKTINWRWGDPEPPWTYRLTDLGQQTLPGARRAA